MEDLTKIDLYALLDVLSSATSQEIKKAYRKRALKCHPDKNPDNPQAAQLFHQLSRALEILTDASARSAYDKVINAKKAAALRNKELDSRRKKLKEDLEARERQAQLDATEQISPEEKFKAEIERLRKEGSKQLEEEIAYIRMQVQQERFGNLEQVDSSLYRLKINWTVLDNDDNNIYCYESLEKIFSKYGEIAALVVSTKKKCSALLEFTSPTAAVKAQQLEKGFLSNPLKVSWLSGTPPSGAKTLCDKGRGFTSPVVGTSIFPSVPTDDPVLIHNQRFPCFPTAPDIFTKTRQEKQDIDFEKAVLSRMRQAEEEKRRGTDKETTSEKS